jgi:hypothetical protein
LLSGVVSAAAVCTIVGCGANVGDGLLPQITIFFDDFDGVLAAGWELDGDGDVPHSLTDRPGFLRIYPQTVSTSTTAATPGVLARELEGDFVVTTRMQFDPLLDFQLAGLVVFGPNADELVTFGLVSASGARGTFRGLLLRADRGADVAPGRAAAVFSGDEVFLRLERTGNTYVGSYSNDGLSFTRVGSVTNDLPGSVEVGLGAIKSDSCGDLCDQIIPADFDFFEVSIPVAGTSG